VGIAAAIVLLAIAAILILASKGDSADAATAVAAKKKGGAGLRTSSKTFRLDQADNAVRYESICPKGKFPYGGGIYSEPDPANGEGVYPNSYERLGVQHGYHINGTLVKVGGGNPAGRNVTVQTICGSKPGKITPPHQTTFVSPGQTKTLTIGCGKRKLMGGGYQRTTGRSADGDVVTESHAVGNAWRVTAHGQGKFGGELTGIAYCLKGTGGNLIKEISASAPIPPLSTATATTPACPKGRKIAFGGFGAPSDGSVMWFGGYITSAGTWAATAYNSSTAATATLTAYAYCLRPFKK
jgi:hypothetical protein